MISTELKKYIEDNASFLDKYIDKLYYNCPGQLRSQLLRVLEESGINIPDSKITENDVIRLLKQWKQQSDGTVVFRNGGIRYTSYEDDFSKYVTIQKLISNLKEDHIPISELDEDPSLLGDYFEEEIFARSYSDVPEYRENKAYLNDKYFGPSNHRKTTFDGSWMTFGIEFRNIDHPNWIYKITSPDNNPIQYQIKKPSDYVWYNKATPATKMQFLPQHNTACRASVFDKLMRQGKIELL